MIMRKYLKKALLLSSLFASANVLAAVPNTPVIDWLPNSFNDGSNLSVSWNMWWGVNGDNWKLLDNGKSVCQGKLTINGENPQSGSCKANYASGPHNIVVQLCNKQICSDSNVQSFSVAGGAANILPMVKLTLPAKANINSEVTLNAQASDSDGKINSVVFYQGDTLLGSDTTPPYSYTFTPTHVGTFEYKAVANDNASAQATSKGSMQVVDPKGTTPEREMLILSKLPLQINMDNQTKKTFFFDGEINKISSRKNGLLSSWTIADKSVTFTAKSVGRTGLKITTSSGESYYMGLRINHKDGRIPGLPEYLSIGSVSEDSKPDLDFWKDISGDLTNKNMDIRYIYINGGPSGDNFWQGWQSWSERRAGLFAKESIRLGLIPFFVYYNIADGGESFTTDLEHVRNPLYMNDYFQDLNLFMDEVQEELQGELYGIILEPDFLGYMQQGGVLHLGTNDPIKITTAVSATDIATGVGNVRTMIERINKTINDKRLEGHKIFFGWQLNLWAYAPTSGSKGVLRRTDDDDLGWVAGRKAIVEGARETTQYGIDAGILTYGADFISIDKYGLDAMIHQNKENPSDSTWFWTNDHWKNYLEFVKVMKETANVPIVLWQLPVGHINGSTEMSAYTEDAFPILDNTDTKGEDSTTNFFFGDTFDSTNDIRLNYFGQNKANDSKLSVTDNMITWGSHFQEAKDAGVIVALFGAGVGASTDGVGSPATDGFFWIQKVQNYYENGPIPLETEYGTGEFVCGERCGPYTAFSTLVDGVEIRLASLTDITIDAVALDEDGTVENLQLEVEGKKVASFKRVGTTDNFTAKWRPSAFTTYQLTLVATDNDGSVAQRSVEIDVVKEGTCTVPAWNKETVYAQNATKVSFGGYVYENKYYITEEAPDPNAPTWGVWTPLGLCQ